MTQFVPEQLDPAPRLEPRIDGDAKKTSGVVGDQERGLGGRRADVVPQLDVDEQI